MANPTSAKPTANIVEWLSTSSTVGELMKCFCPLLAGGGHRDIVGNVLAEPHIGPINSSSLPVMGGFGHPPSVVSNGFVFGAASDATYKFGCGTTGLRFPSRGWSSLSNNRTFGIVVKPTFGGQPVTQTIPLWGVGSDSSFHGIALQVSTAGVITVGRFYAGTFSTAAITLTSGNWYMITMTHDTTTSCIFNVWSYNSDSSVASATRITGLSTPNPGSATDAVLNSYSNYNSQSTASFIGEVHSCWLSDASFDPGVNATYFSAIVADPCAPARGTYTATGTLAAGGITNYDATTTSITIVSNRPTLGAAGDETRYQYRLHRSTTNGFTPGVGTRIGSLQSSRVLVDSTAVAGVTYCYKVEQTDGTNTVYSTTATANSTQTYGRLSKGDLFILGIGDSRWSTIGYGASIALMRSLRAAGWRCGYLVMGLQATYVTSGTASLSWQPSTTGSFSDPTNGQASTTLLANALIMGQYAGCTHAHVNLGTNDAVSNTAAATLGTKYALIKNQVLAASMVMVCDFPYQINNAEATGAYIQAYQAQISALENGTTVRVLASNEYDVSSSGIEALARDHAHINDAGLVGAAAAIAWLAMFDPVPAPFIEG